MRIAIFLLLAAVAVFGQQAALTDRIPYDPSVPFGLPQEVHEFLEGNNWGDFHLVFHMARKYYVVGDSGRAWMDDNGVKPAPYQEGQANNGIEFLCMHRAMLEYLSQRFGSVPVTNDPDGRQTVADVLRGWSSDDQVISGLQKARRDVNTFRGGLANVNNFGRFKSEDEFGNFIQTAMRTDANRGVTSDRSAGAGVHNWLHGQMQDDNSPITVGDPRTNLPNILFWRIHGWIEAKWKQFEASRTRSSSEQAIYDQFMAQFRAHVISMSGKGVPVPNPAPPRPTTTTTTTTTTKKTKATTVPTTTTTRRIILGRPAATTKPTRIIVGRPAATTKPPKTRRGLFGGLFGRPAHTKAPSTGRSLFSYEEPKEQEQVVDEFAALEQEVVEIGTMVDAYFKKDLINILADGITRNLHRVSHAAHRGVPWHLVKRLRGRFFRNHVVRCRQLAPGYAAENCPAGRDSDGDANPIGPDGRPLYNPNATTTAPAAQY